MHIYPWVHTVEYTFIYIHTLTYKSCFLYLKFSITVCPLRLPRRLNTLRSSQYGRHYTDDIFKWIFLSKNVWISIIIPLEFFFLGGTINIIPALAQTMPWCRPGDKPLSEPMVVSLLTRICIARPQWVKYDYNLLILDDNKNGKPIGLQFTTREGIFKHWNSMVLRQDEWRCDSIFVSESLYHFQVLQKFLLRVTNTTINVASQRQCPTLSPTLFPDAISKCQIHAQIISESLRSDLESLRFCCWISFVKLTIALLLLCPAIAVPTQWSRDKMAKFCRRLFHVHLRQWLFLYIGCNFIGPYYQRSNWQ